jgi:hypothetical protein
MPWSNLRTTQIASSTSSSTMLIVHIHETVEAAPKFVMTLEPDYGQLHPHLGWLSIDTIKKTFEHTTQLGRMPMSTILKKGYKSPNPDLNVHHHDKPVATDTIHSNTQSIVALPLLSSLLVLRPTQQMCILSSPINSLSICFWTTSPNVVHLPNSSATAHSLR